MKRSLIGSLAATLLLAGMASARWADTTPPTVVFSQPVASPASTFTARRGAMVWIGAKASDAGMVRSITIVHPGGAATGYAIPPAPWIVVRSGWSTEDSPAGNYILSCIAYDKAGNRTEKTITVRLTP